MNKTIIRRADGSIRVQFSSDKPERTKQAFKDQCDVNNIIKRYKQTGELVSRARGAGVFRDVSEIGDYAESLMKVQNARAAFDLLPAELRREFDNDPQKMLNFMQDPKNYQRGVELGLFEKPIKPNSSNDDSNDDKKTAQQASKKTKAQPHKDSVASGDE